MNQPAPPLTSAQRKQLRQLGQKLDEQLQLGKSGMSEAFAGQLDRMLMEKELVKLRFGKDIQGDARSELGNELAQAVNARCVAVIGHVVLLYRPNPKLEPKKRITLD